jgi:hypothetical protein
MAGRGDAALVGIASPFAWPRQHAQALGKPRRRRYGPERSAARFRIRATEPRAGSGAFIGSPGSSPQRLQPAPVCQAPGRLRQSVGSIFIFSPKA